MIIRAAQNGFTRRAREAVRHSAFEDFQRDERRPPAVLLLSARLLAAVFFALGIYVRAPDGRQQCLFGWSAVEHG